MSAPLLPPEMRERCARGAAALMAMPDLCAAVRTEVAATFEEHPTLPRTPEAAQIVWALLLPRLSEAASAAEASQNQQEKKRA